MVQPPLPSFRQIWTGVFPYSDGSGEKHRTLFVLGFNPARSTVFAVKITSTDPRTVFAGQFAIMRSDRFYPGTGLQKECKLDFNEVVELHTSKLTKQIGILDLSDQKTAHRFMSAIEGSRYADAIAQIGRDFG